MKRSFPLLFSAVLLFFGVKAFRSFTPTQPANQRTNLHTAPNALKNMFGINAYEWNFLQNPNNLNDASHIYEPKMQLLKCFSGVRHYLDWSKIETTPGNYTFNPATNGGWNYDAIYQRCKQDGIEVLTCLKTCPQWLVDTYPAIERDNENVPAPYGLNREDPVSYLLQAKAAFQFAARYGYNTGASAALVKVNSKPRWTNDPVNQVKIGMGLVKYMECDNERDKWWKGKKAQQTPAEYAANLSAFYDGDKGRLGKDVGVKTADPSMQVVMAGLAGADPKYVEDMIAWCKKHRGYKPDGSVNLCFDVINYHYYPNDSKEHFDKKATRGMAPELTDAAAVADNFVKLANSLKQRPEVWVTETGYDINPQSPQRAMAIGNKTAEITQADWLLRTALLFNRHGIKHCFYYQLFDDNQSSTQFATSGMADGETLKRKPAADYILQVNRLMGDYMYQGTISQNPLVDVYRLGSKTVYVLMVPDEKGRTANCQLKLTGAKQALIHSLKASAESMTTESIKVVNGLLNIPVTETPVFVEALN